MAGDTRHRPVVGGLNVTETVAAARYGAGCVALLTPRAESQFEFEIEHFDSFGYPMHVVHRGSIVSELPRGERPLGDQGAPVGWVGGIRHYSGHAWELHPSSSDLTDNDAGSDEH